MEQMLFFLTEYANEMTAAGFLLVMVLLLIVLHRIRRIEVQLTKLQERMTPALETEISEERTESEVQIAESAEQMEQGTADRPEELLSAVLGEVFS
ncbi:MAG: hypothetical protein HFI35_08370 [Roseburia sp.]|jgi:C4-dicarboxylate-specific signal transduction histidine kinase|nr:hypothetical protein [Roseburia sp.]